MGYYYGNYLGTIICQKKLRDVPVTCAAVSQAHAKDSKHCNRSDDSLHSPVSISSLARQVMTERQESAI